MSQIGGLLVLDEGIGSRENVSTLKILELVVGVGKMLVRWKYWSWWYSVSRGFPFHYHLLLLYCFQFGPLQKKIAIHYVICKFLF